MSLQKLIDGLPSRSKVERAQMRANAERLQTGGSSNQQSDAVALLAALDGLETGERDAFTEQMKALEVDARILRAFADLPMTETEAKVLRALILHPGSTTEELSKAAGWKGNGWHLHFGKMCERRAVYLWPAPRAKTRDANFWSGILADIDAAGTRFTMKPDVAAAFAQLGLRPAPA